MVDWFFGGRFNSSCFGTAPNESSVWALWLPPAPAPGAAEIYFCSQTPGCSRPIETRPGPNLVVAANPIRRKEGGASSGLAPAWLVSCGSLTLGAMASGSFPLPFALVILFQDLLELLLCFCILSLSSFFIQTIVFLLQHLYYSCLFSYSNPVVQYSPPPSPRIPTSLPVQPFAFAYSFDSCRVDPWLSLIA